MLISLIPLPHNAIAFFVWAFFVCYHVVAQQTTDLIGLPLHSSLPNQDQKEEAVTAFPLPKYNVEQQFLDLPHLHSMAPCATEGVRQLFSSLSIDKRCPQYPCGYADCICNFSPAIMSKIDTTVKDSCRDKSAWETDYEAHMATLWESYCNMAISDVTPFPTPDTATIQTIVETTPDPILYKRTEEELQRQTFDTIIGCSVMGVVVFFGLIIWITVYCIRKKRKAKRQERAEVTVLALNSYEAPLEAPPITPAAAPPAAHPASRS